VAAATAAQTRAANLRGAAFLLGSGAAFAVTAALVKAAGDSGISSFQTVLVRAVIGLIVVTPLLWRRGIVPWRTSHLKLHLSRAVAGGSAIIIGFYAFTVIPLADATAIGFTTPLFVTVLAVVFLGEQVGWRRWSATAAGFIGVVVIVQPGGSGFDPISLIVLVQALFIALSVVVVKRFPARESQLSMLFFTFTSSGLFSSWFAIDKWVTPDTHQALLLLGVAAAGIAAQAMVLRAYRLGEASFIAPLSYIRLIFAGILGAIWFAEYPDIWVGVGSVIVVAAALYTARRASSADAHHPAGNSLKE
jgi:drug/metabolite transporter (DMT)-like permease